MEYSPYLIDTTLRDGEQAPGVVFSTHDKISISELLEKLGIREIEIGTPAMGKKEIEDIRCIINQGFRFKTLSWCRGLKQDIDNARLAGTNGVHISFPVSEIHLITMGKNYEWILKELKETIHYSKDYFEYVTVGAQDASRADKTFLVEFIENANDLGISRIRIADTVGILNPFNTYSLFLELHSRFPDLPFEFHGHNDLGMATANTISALKGGASCASVTVNGLGERAGNAALEEVIMAWELSFKKSFHLNSTFLGPLSDLISKLSKIPIHSNKPIVGSKVLQHETGIHANLLLKNRQTYQIISADSIGRKENELIIGKHSGKKAIKHFYENRNIHLSDSSLEKISELIKVLSMVKKRSLNETELIQLVKNTLI